MSFEDSRVYVNGQFLGRLTNIELNIGLEHRSEDYGVWGSSYRFLSTNPTAEMRVHVEQLLTSGRPGWDDYFLGFAEAASRRAECTRRKVGAVVVRKKRIVGTGYNGAPAKAKETCLTGHCPRSQSDVTPGSSYDTGPGACISIHAEANALLDAGRQQAKGSTLYITDKPCDGCLKLIAGSGISRAVWPGDERKIN